MREKSAYIAAVIVGLLSGCASQQQSLQQPADDSGMLVVKSGRFVMGRDGGQINEGPEHKVDITDFKVDRTEVSAADFAAFLNESGNPDSVFFTINDRSTVVAVQSPEGEKDTRFAARPGYERFPANNVSWKGAAAYCRWRGKRLPTEAEWEKAARGTDKRLFPWGKSEPTADDARFEQVWEAKKFDVLVPVDALPKGASPYGLLNMAGNVLEWTGDWYRQNLCDFCNPEREGNLDLIRQLTQPETDIRRTISMGDGKRGEIVEAEQKRDQNQTRQAPPRDNPSGPSLGVYKVLKGGSWQDIDNEDLAVTRRFWLDPDQRFPNTGFRCSKESARRL